MDDLAENLIQYFETKDVSYFDKFYYSLYPLAYKVSVLITNNSADAEDVAQTAFYTVFNQIETCLALKEKNNQKIKSWFLSIVYNHSKLVVRSRVRNKKKHQSQEKQNEYNESAPQMSKYLESKMKSAINSLDEKYRTPIILKYNEGLNSNEISEILQVNESTLRVRISRGLSKVKELLTKDKVEFEELLPSISLLTFDNYSNVPAIPKFANTNAIQLKITPYANYFTNAKVIILSVLIVISSITLFNLYTTKEEIVSPISIPLIAENNPIQEDISLKKMTWDFTSGNIHHFNVLVGKWDFISNGMVTTGMEEPNATLVSLPFKPHKYFKIKFIGKMELGRNARTIALKGVYLKNEEILPQTEIFKQFFSKELDPRKLEVENGFKVTPLDGTVYFTEKYISATYFNDFLAYIAESPLQKDFNNKCIFVRGFKTQRIEYTPLSDIEMQNIELELENKLKLETKK